jgi:putative transposase
MCRTVFHSTVMYLAFHSSPQAVCVWHCFLYRTVLGEAGVATKRLSLRSPNLNAYVERFIQTLQVECLDHFLAFGTKHLDYLVQEFVAYYHEFRPHQGLGNRLLPKPGVPLDDTDDEPASLPLDLALIKCETRLGGLLRHYYRSAA